MLRSRDQISIENSEPFRLELVSWVLPVESLSRWGCGRPPLRGGGVAEARPIRSGCGDDRIDVDDDIPPTSSPISDISDHEGRAVGVAGGDASGIRCQKTLGSSLSLFKKSDEETETETSRSTPVSLCMLLVLVRERRTGAMAGLAGTLQHQQFLPRFFLNFMQKYEATMKSITSRT